MDRERKFYEKQRDQDPQIRATASNQDTTSIYMRAHTISQAARSKSQLSQGASFVKHTNAPPPLAEVKQANAAFATDPRGMLANIESNFTFTKVLEPVRTSQGNFNDYDAQGSQIKLKHRVAMP